MTPSTHTIPYTSPALQRTPHVQGSTRRAVYNYITLFTQQNGYAPTVREIATGLGICSTATVHRHMVTLAHEGLILRSKNKARAVTVCEN